MQRGNGHRLSAGTMPMMNEPCFVIRKPEEADQLVWDSNCGINLANYLTNRKEKIAIVAKGCDSRNIVTHIIENKIKRDQVVTSSACPAPE
jgi:formate dehydrogenase subunit beta